MGPGATHPSLLPPFLPTLPNPGLSPGAFLSLAPDSVPRFLLDPSLPLQLPFLCGLELGEDTWVCNFLASASFHWPLWLPDGAPVPTLHWGLNVVDVSYQAWESGPRLVLGAFGIWDLSHHLPGQV